VRQQKHEAIVTWSGDDSPGEDSTTASFDTLREEYHGLRDEIERGFTDIERGFSQMRDRLHASAIGQQRLIESYVGNEGK